MKPAVSKQEQRRKASTNDGGVQAYAVLNAAANQVLQLLTGTSIDCCRNRLQTDATNRDINKKINNDLKASQLIICARYLLGVP